MEKHNTYQQLEHHSPQFTKYPQGSTKMKIAEAKLANPATTVDLVPNHERDAYYFRALEKMGIYLNEPQLQAVRHYTGPALVLAGAGSGKTRVLTSRAGYLLSVQQIRPEQMLLLTFTRKAAEEMKERIAALPGLTKNMVRQLLVGTYHSIFLQLLRGQGEQRRILSSEKQKQTMLKIILKEMGLKDDYDPENLLDILSHYKNRMVTVENMPEKTPVEKEIKAILRIYENKKQELGYMDFDDILLDAYLLLKQQQPLLENLQHRFAFILCDEWQDTNPIQYELIKMLAAPQNNLFVVGDDDQTIYEFNGADSSIILNFPDQFPETKRFTLNINYRSTTSIVGLANQIIAFNKNRFAKTLTATKTGEHSPFYLRPQDSDEEAKQIVDQIMLDCNEGGRSLKDFAVLYRNNSNSRSIFEELVLRDIPFVRYGDTNTFYEHPIIKPVIDHLRLAFINKNMDAVYGILPSLYLNREKALDFIMRKELVTPESHALLHLLDYPGLKDFQKKQIRERIQLLNTIKALAPVKAIQEVRKVYDKYIEADERKNLTMQREIMKEMLAELESSAKRFETIAEFLNFVDFIIRKNEEMKALTQDPDADVIRLMTIHRAKGLEFPVVYVIGASETILPHKIAIDAGEKEIEEERRLLYVAVTRAEEELYISSPRYYRGAEVEISRFIKDVFTDLDERKKEIRSKEEKAAKKVGKRKSKRKRVQSILVWDCTSDTCNAWMRIESHEDSILKHKDCPLCGSRMEQTVREIIS